MSPELEDNSNTKAAELDNVTASLVQKDSSPDSTSTDTAGPGEAVVPSPFTVQDAALAAPTGTKSKKPSKSATTSATVPITTTAATTTTTNNNHDTDAARLNIDPDNVSLLFNDIDDALGDGLIGREPMNIPNDDVATNKTATKSQEWVTKLIAAFGKNYLATPEESSKNSPAQLEWHSRWQKQAHTTVVAIINAKNPSHLEKSCWYLFDALVKTHELGIVNAGNNLTPSDLICSKRLDFIVSIIEKYALVRLDVLRAWHVDEMTANPEKFIERKLTNCWNNMNRANKTKAAKEEKKASGNAVGSKKQTAADGEKVPKVAGKKRAARSAEEPEEQSVVQTPVTDKKARKSGVQSSKAEDIGDDVDDNNFVTTTTTTKSKGKNKSSAAKRSRSAMTPGSGDKKATPRKRAAHLKTPSDESVNKSHDGEEDDAGDELWRENDDR